MGTDAVEDILVLENKLSSTTSLTAPQNAALKSSSYRVRSRDKYSQIIPDNKLKYGMELKFSKFYNIYETNTINKTHKVMIMLSCEFHLTLKNKI
jgi:hypothetical protein